MGHYYKKTNVIRDETFYEVVARGYGISINAEEVKGSTLLYDLSVDKQCMAVNIRKKNFLEKHIFERDKGKIKEAQDIIDEIFLWKMERGKYKDEENSDYTYCINPYFRFRKTNLRVADVIHAIVRVISGELRKPNRRCFRWVFDEQNILYEKADTVIGKYVENLIKKNDLKIEVVKEKVDNKIIFYAFHKSQMKRIELIESEKDENEKGQI